MQTSQLPSAAAERKEVHARASFWKLTLGSVGVVYGDIGTSPLYAFREAVAAASAGGEVTREIVIGILSLLVWTLVLVVTIKYVIILLRADNNGEGGTLSLLALALRALGKGRSLAMGLGLVGAGLFYGDAMITPAISVLSSVEGLKIVTPALGPYVVTITVVILASLFAVQSHGTGKVATFFGPIIAFWFLTLAVIGLMHIADDPSVFAALSPTYGLMFLINNPGVALAVMGGVALVATGAEALYADLGHFGRGPIRTAWLGLVFPALLLNYFGQGALVLTNPAAIENPFYRLVPEWATLPLVLLATTATIIASQAVITGAFSLTSQAVQLGLLPRLQIRFTSETQQGQIYLPRVNAILFMGVLALVLFFGSSSDLAHAYGVSVYGAMVVDAILAIIVIWKGWKWGLRTALALMLPLLIVELGFFGANLTKLFTGGYVPVLIAAALIVVMWTWLRGTRILFEKTRKNDVPLSELVDMLAKSPPHRVKGTAVFLTSDPKTAPTALLHNLKHNKCLHEKSVILTVRTTDTPHIPDQGRVNIEHIGDGFWKMDMTYGTWRRRTFHAASPCFANRASSSTLWQPPSSYPAARSGQQQGQECQRGRTSCSSLSLQRRAMPATSFRFRVAGSLRLALRSRSDPKPTGDTSRPKSDRAFRLPQRSSRDGQALSPNLSPLPTFTRHVHGVNRVNLPLG